MGGFYCIGAPSPRELFFQIHGTFGIKIGKNIIYIYISISLMSPIDWLYLEKCWHPPIPWSLLDRLLCAWDTQHAPVTSFWHWSRLTQLIWCKSRFYLKGSRILRNQIKYSMTTPCYLLTLIVLPPRSLIVWFPCEEYLYSFINKSYN